MDTTIIGMLATGAGTAIAVVGLVSRSIGHLRSHMDQRIDALAHASQLAHDAIGVRIDGLRTELGGRIEAQGTELGGRIDGLRTELGGRIEAQGAELGGRIDALEARMARIGDDVAFMKGRLTQPDG